LLSLSTLLQPLASLLLLLEASFSAAVACSRRSVAGLPPLSTLLPPLSSPQLLLEPAVLLLEAACARALPACVRWLRRRGNAAIELA